MIASVMALVAPIQAYAGHQGWNASASAMGLSNSQDQGGLGPSGSTLLTQIDAFYNLPWVGFGLFAQLDRQGSSETDFGLGPKMEIHYGPFFLEAAYAIALNQSFTDRSIAKQSGKGAFYGAGIRLNILTLANRNNIFIQAAYKFRTVSITEQDSSKISEPITQNDTYPLIGAGYAF